MPPEDHHWLQRRNRAGLQGLGEVVRRDLDDLEKVGPAPCFALWSYAFNMISIVIYHKAIPIS